MFFPFSDALWAAKDGKTINPNAVGHGVEKTLEYFRKRTPLGKAVLGSVAQRVALGALCPVGLVK